MNTAELLAACPWGIVSIEQVHQAGGDQRVLDGVQALRRLGMMFARLLTEAGSMADVGSGHSGVTGCYDAPQFNNSADFKYRRNALQRKF